VVARGHQGAVDDEGGVPAESAPLPERQQRTEAINNAVCGLTRIRRPRPLRHRLDPPVGTWRAKPVGVLYLPDQQHRPGPGAACLRQGSAGMDSGAPQWNGQPRIRPEHLTKSAR